jgi:hypothetical protein
MRRNPSQSQRSGEAVFSAFVLAQRGEAKDRPLSSAVEKIKPEVMRGLDPRIQAQMIQIL